jgi:toxin ParE1/3/4
MARRVIWSKSALADVDSIADYISRDSAAYAATVVRKILDSVRHLMRFPNSGRQVPELQDPAIRELFVYSYRIIYRVSQTEVLIVAVIHGKRDLG